GGVLDLGHQDLLAAPSGENVHPGDRGPVAPPEVRVAGCGVEGDVAPRFGRVVADRPVTVGGVVDGGVVVDGQVGRDALEGLEVAGVDHGAGVGGIEVDDVHRVGRVADVRARVEDDVLVRAEDFEPLVDGGCGCCDLADALFYDGGQFAGFGVGA